MPAPRDRQVPHPLERVGPHPWPSPPLNVRAASGFRRECVDIRWDSLALQANSCFNVLGVNIYRSFDSAYGPFERLNLAPVGGNFWRDQSDVVLVLREDVSRSFTVRGAPDDPWGRWMFRTANSPIVIQHIPGAPNCTDLNVQVTVNGVASAVAAVYADQGIVELSNRAVFDVASQSKTPPVLPHQASDVVLATYRWRRNQVKLGLSRRVFYRITAVAHDPATGQLVETPLQHATQTNRDEIERSDAYWAEAVRRSKWVLYQGGERVQVFIRKTAGVKCQCTPLNRKTPDQSCLVCFGTGWIGGYEGPYDIILSPDDSPKNVRQSERGRSLDHAFESWTAPMPLLSQRDFVVRQNGDRYGLGPVRTPSNRGNQLLQFFTLNYLDETDVRYQVPIPDPAMLRSPETRWIVPGEGSSTPMMTDKATVPAERQMRWNSVTGENQNY